MARDELRTRQGSGRPSGRKPEFMMLWTRGQWHSHDTYDQPIRTKRRHRLCSCTVPCQGRFTCAACGRSKPWCVGSDDEVCDTCWCTTFDRTVHVPDAQPGARAS